MIRSKGFLGSDSRGKELVERVCKWASRTRQNIVVKKVQVSETFGGKNLYVGGMSSASKHLIEEISLMRKKIPSLRYISFLGTSYGGLVVRHVIGKLKMSSVPARDLHSEEEEDLETWIPCFFVSFLSPFLGAVCERPSWKLSLAPTLFFFSGAIKELFMKDARAQREPLLLELSKGEYLLGLSRFRTRVVVGSIHDKTVSLENAFFDLQPLEFFGRVGEEKGESRVLGVKKYAPNGLKPAERGPPFYEKYAPKETLPHCTQISTNLLNLSFFFVAVTGLHDGPSKAAASEEVTNKVLEIVEKNSQF